jgi:hypothetical protein
MAFPHPPLRLACTMLLSCSHRAHRSASGAPTAVDNHRTWLWAGLRRCVLWACRSFTVSTAGRCEVIGDRSSVIGTFYSFAAIRGVETRLLMSAQAPCPGETTLFTSR